jgi:hypothetical protein
LYVVRQYQRLRERSRHPDNGPARLRERTGHGRSAHGSRQRRFAGTRSDRQTQLTTGESFEPGQYVSFPRPQGQRSADTLTLRYRERSAPCRHTSTGRVPTGRVPGRHDRRSRPHRRARLTFPLALTADVFTLRLAALLNVSVWQAASG